MLYISYSNIVIQSLKNIYTFWHVTSYIYYKISLNINMTMHIWMFKYVSNIDKDSTSSTVLRFIYMVIFCVIYVKLMSISIFLWESTFVLNCWSIHLNVYLNRWSKMAANVENCLILTRISLVSIIHVRLLAISWIIYTS